VQDWLILEASSVSYGKATSYLPLIDLLKGYFKIGDRDDHREMRAKVLGRVLGLDRALEPLLPPLLALLDVPVEDAAWQALDPPERRQRTLDAVKRLLLRECLVQPLLVVFEDLHWVDSETQALLDSLVDSVGSARLLLLVNYRPEYSHRWGSKTAYSQLRLDSLPAESAAELLAALLGPDPGLVPLTQMLVKRGNPFFLEEMVRTLVETGALAGERGAYRLTRPVEALQVPATVQTILAARIDRLPPEEKQLLQAASAIGKDVPYALLAAIAEQPEEALRRGLGHLQEAEFLHETQLFPDSEYTFKHALTHEVTYGGLLQERRRALHGRIVEAIERLYGERLTEQVERLGHHALRGEVWEKALAYCRQAGDKAMVRSSYREAEAHFEQALAALPHLPARRDTIEAGIDVRFSLRNTLLALGAFDRLLEHLREAERLAETLDDPRRQGWASSYLANYFFRTGEPDRALAPGRAALTLATVCRDIRLQVASNFQLGLAHSSLGNYEQAIDLNRQIVQSLDDDTLYERFGLAGFASVLSRMTLVACCADTGAFIEGIARGEEGIRIAEAADHPDSLTRIYWAVGRLFLCRGDFARAIPTLERGLGVCQSVNIPSQFTFLASTLGYAYALSGRVPEALSLLEQAVEQATSMRNLLSHSIMVAWLSETHLLAGRMEEARDLAGRALEHCRARKERGTQAWVLQLLAKIGAHQDPSDVTEAAVHYRQTLALANELGMRPLVAHCHLGLGKLSRRTDQREQAHEHLTIATTMYREMGMRFWLEQAEAEMREWA
jgi:tetratricopeptide (TPR) repeat protein